ncbi:WD40 repeat-like protein [Yamadazyma tenuis ATCC 10573]|uniref:WD40 repeat-like protein n=1 Tax=Candida tenuis (strain ATCC 10573 / BCRC 21748 / CBS 615 / JCM 9827 / NBRC 10315 / NRRL Y-1498 / VKM Y-70) TaxID=590646 RepID=G3B7Q9_CANTC|nr:WD40 repeat-like protein [Yamadazyma tenuis ATCC 10573]EGV62845.1 WD40 repeat-like protein [Yamadazyma tenuis ATCC 10573]
MSVVKKQKIANNLALSKVSDDVDSGKILYNRAVVLEGHQGPVYSAAINSELIVSGGDDKTINIWKLPTDDNDVNLGCIRGHKAAVTSVCWMNGNIVSGSADSTMAIWDGETGQKIRNYRNSTIINQVRSGNIFFSGIDPTIQAYDTRATDKSLWTTSSTIDSITSLDINNDNSMLVSRSTRGAVSTYNAKEFLPENVSRSSPYVYDGAPSGNEYKLIRACFSGDSSRIASGSDDKTVTVWDVVTRRILNKFEGHEASTLDVTFHPSENIVISTSLDGTLIVREL